MQMVALAVVVVLVVVEVLTSHVSLAQGYDDDYLLHL